LDNLAFDDFNYGRHNSNKATYDETNGYLRIIPDHFIKRLHTAAVRQKTTPTGSEGIGMGSGSGVMERHHAQVPEDYAGLSNPVAVDSESLRRGEQQYG
jgi:hypothetical protein